MQVGSLTDSKPGIARFGGQRPRGKAAAETASGSPETEADAVLPAVYSITRRLRNDPRGLTADDRLLVWFTPATAAILRNLERRIRRELVGQRTLTPEGVRLENIAGIAAAFYVALFGFARKLAARGIWVGGIVPLGHEVREHKLVIEEDEVRSSF